jgi:hypothetical protein
VALQPAVEIVALAEATNEDNARDDASIGAEAVDLALHEIAHFLDDWFKYFLNLRGRHDQEARVEPCLFVIGKTREAKSLE